MSETILQLESHVIDQIAAGEVVERPAHLVKELVENSLDAGATEIQVEVSDECTGFRVQDNGRGIAPEQLSLALDRHTTSKIRRADDLWALSTYGFRGEALSSIASVSEVTLSSRQENQATGFSLTCRFGSKEPVTPAGLAKGTTVLVRRLFENLPARRKFMKTEGAEVAMIRQTLRAEALARPEVSFQFRVNGKLDLFFPRNQAPAERAKQVLGLSEVFEAQSSDRGSGRVQTFFGNPREAAKTSRNMWFFVQRRWVQDKTINAAVMEGFRGTLMHGEYPAIALFVDLAPEDVDVNIHPSKSQIKFNNSSDIFRLVSHTLKSGVEGAPWNANLKNSVRSASAQASPSANVEQAVRNYSAEHFQKTPEQIQILGSMDKIVLKAKPSFQSFEGKDVSAKKISIQDVSIKEVPIPEVSTTEHMGGDVEGSPSFWSRFAVLGQAHSTYILCQGQEGLVLVDQHAAHERVMYERLMKRWSASAGEVQQFLIPLVVDLPTDQVELILTREDFLGRLGISVERLGPSSLGVMSAPAFLKDSSIPPSFELLGQQLTDWGESVVLKDRLSDFCARLACHSAIRAGQSLSLEEMKALLVSMDETLGSSFCPHGRPVSVEYKLSEIERDFGRTL